MITTSPSIGIIGGKGKMGQWFARFFKDLGLEVLISDLDTALTPIDLVREAEVTVVSVPMEAFNKVVGEIGPHIPKGHFLTDLCSLKERQVQYMWEHTNGCEFCGTHPLFGPFEDSIEGRRVAICPGRGDEWTRWWETLLRDAGAKTFRVPAQVHDTVMAWVQALNHFILISLGMSLDELPLDKETIFNLATPSFERQMKIVERLRHQDPELYATIQFSNPHTLEALDGFMTHANGLLSAIKKGDRDSFIEIFKRVQAFGGKGD